MDTQRLHLFELTEAATRADAWITRLDPARRDAFGVAAQKAASARGLMRGTDEIPLVLSPVSLPREELTFLGRAAHLLVSALTKVAREVIEKKPERVKVLFEHLSPLEHEALRTRWREAEELLVARVDWFVDKQGRPQALEVNSTIPAMQVYSDAAVLGFLDAYCGEAAESLAAK
ncbi:MAG: hypothetical protein JST92_23815, partial [Deltaproteobacteria bacterium]|nr:hypothetical protein [Deltaproteobacteria bacterium]